MAVGILARCEELLLELGDMELILEHLKQDVPKWPKPVLQVRRGVRWCIRGVRVPIGRGRGGVWGRGVLLCG